jgi:CheY-like chemotaxis protein
MTTTRPILIVENEENDVLFLRHAFKKAGIQHPLQVVESGQEAIAYLKGEGAFSDRVRYPVPLLVLLDLKLKGVDGIDVLRWLRRESSYPTLPVIILSGSILADDISEAYLSGANSYIGKVADPAELAEIVSDFSNWWLKRNYSPH